MFSSFAAAITSALDAAVGRVDDATTGPESQVPLTPHLKPPYPVAAPPRTSSSLHSNTSLAATEGFSQPAQAIPVQQSITEPTTTFSRRGSSATSSVHSLYETAPSTARPSVSHVVAAGIVATPSLLLSSAVMSHSASASAQPPPGAIVTRARSSSIQDPSMVAIHRPRTSSIRDPNIQLPCPGAGHSHEPAIVQGVASVMNGLSPYSQFQNAQLLPPRRSSSTSGTSVPITPVSPRTLKRVSLAQIAGAANRDVSWLATIPDIATMHDEDGVAISPPSRPMSLSGAASMESLRSAVSVDLGVTTARAWEEPSLSPPSGTRRHRLSSAFFSGTQPAAMALAADVRDANSTRRMSKRISTSLEFPSLIASLGIDTTVGASLAISSPAVPVHGFNPALVPLTQIDVVHELCSLLAVPPGDEVASTKKELQQAIELVSNVVSASNPSNDAPLPAAEFLIWALKRALAPNTTRAALIQHSDACRNVAASIDHAAKTMTPWPCGGDVDQGVVTLRQHLSVHGPIRSVLTRPWCSAMAASRAVKLLERDPRFFARQGGIWGVSKRVRAALKALSGDVDAEIARQSAAVSAPDGVLLDQGDGCGRVHADVRRRWVTLLDDVLSVCTREAKKMRLAGAGGAGAVDIRPGPAPGAGSNGAVATSASSLPTVLTGGMHDKRKKEGRSREGGSGKKTGRSAPSPEISALLGGAKLSKSSSTKR